MRDPQRPRPRCTSRSPCSASRSSPSSLGVLHGAGRRSGGRRRRDSASSRRRVKNPHQLAQAAARRRPAPDLAARPRSRRSLHDVPPRRRRPGVRAAHPAPFTTHPGTWLTTHPPERFGCTACHDGQGAGDRLRARGARSRTPFVARPMRPLETIEANCGTCHRSLDPPDAPRLAEGRRLIAGVGLRRLPRHPGLRGRHVPRPRPRQPRLQGAARRGWRVAEGPEELPAELEDGELPVDRRRDRGLCGRFLLSQTAQAPLDSTGVDWKKADTANGRRSSASCAA